MRNGVRVDIIDCLASPPVWTQPAFQLLAAGPVAMAAEKAASAISKPPSDKRLHFDHKVVFPNWGRFAVYTAYSIIVLRYAGN
jgi:hypothetical protein